MKYSVEKWDECVEDMRPLWPLHWREAYSQDIKPVPNEPSYRALSQNNIMQIITARDAQGRLWGYIWLLISPNFHNTTLSSAIMDLWFMHPLKRAGGSSIKMLKYAEKKLKDFGVQYLYGGHTKQLPLNKLYNKLGFELTEYHYTKRLSNG